MVRLSFRVLFVHPTDEANVRSRLFSSMAEARSPGSYMVTQNSINYRGSCNLFVFFFTKFSR